MRRTITPLHVALAYAVVGAIYILGSDWALRAFDGDILLYERLQTWKGWGFILLTSIALWLTLRAASSRQAHALRAALKAEDRLRMALTAAEGFLWQTARGPGGELVLRASGGLARRLALSEAPGLRREELLNRAHPADRRALRDLLDGIRAGDARLPDPICRLRQPDGRWRWVKIVPDPASRTNDPDGQLSGVAFDISDQQGAAQDLAEVIAGGGLGTWRLDLETGTNQVNDRWAELIGYTREELGPITLPLWEQLVHPDDLARLVRSQAAQVDTDDFFFSEEIRMRHKAGHWVWILSRGRAVDFRPDGAPRVLSGVHVDITRRKALESALRSERDFLQGLTETSVSGVLVLDAMGRVIFTNREAERLLGVPGARMIGRRHDDPAWQAMTLEGQPMATPDFPFAQIAAGAVLRDMRMAFRSPDGTLRRISVNGAQLKAQDGVAQVVCTITDITERLEAEEQLRQASARALHEALHDKMTGLPYRALFEDHLTAAIATAGEAPVALVFLNLDDFKAVNDRFGHHQGDRLIKLCAARLEAQRRPGQVVARLAADEFGILQPAATPAEVAALLQSLAQVFETPFDLDGRQVWVTATLGLGLWPEDGEDAAGVWRNADLAMHEAKARGRAQVLRFSDSLRRRLDHEADVADALQRALRDRAFRLVLQPKVALADPARIVGAEVLLRCESAELAAVGPSVFIPVAERHGLVAAIDLVVIELLGAVVAELRAAGRALPLSVNLSPESLRRPDFGDRLLAQLARSGLTPAEISFELTEGAVMDLASCAHDHVEALLAAGYDLAADDFGTGYSSLAYLHRLRLKELKIDRSFIARLGQPGDGAPEIVRAIIAMAQALGLRVVAEGVETAAQADWLHRAGCEVGQGFLFGRGVTPAEFLQLCAEPVS